MAWRAAALALAILLAAPAAAAQQGLLGEYFDGTALIGLADTRIDAQIDFTGWGNAPTGTAVAPDNNYSERWTGWVQVPATGAWTFRTHSNDGVRLWIDGVLLIDHWDQHGATFDQATASLTAGWKPLRLEHFQQGGSVVIQLSWSGPGQTLQIIPSGQLAASFSGNLAPVADAGPDQVVFSPASSAVLSGSGSDADGVITGWQWSQVSGPVVALSGASSPTLTVAGLPLLAPCTFELTVTDDAGASHSDQATVLRLESGVPGGTVSGEARVWHRVTVSFDGSQTGEQATPNPFRDRRLDVVFANLDTGTLLMVPGHFAADGDAAESSAAVGRTWRAHFMPPEPGTWLYQASFRAGTDVAASLTPGAGVSAEFDGATGLFVVAPADPGAPGFLGEGLLRYDGGHFLRFAGSGRAFLKGGANSPENLLAYGDFDQTSGSHLYQPHAGDWNAGDPQWQGTRGRELIGALNYLAGKGMNAVYFLTFNVAGDGDDVWPWTSKGERLRFDVSKLDQWERVFSHMDQLGLLLHVVTQETENDNGSAGLDGGGLGLQRKLYYRELVSRFGHHPALLWNLGEENSNTTTQIKSFHDHLRALDPYEHPIVMHTFPWQAEVQYGPLLDLQLLEGASMQLSSLSEVHDKTLFWRAESLSHGHPWVLGMDEFGPAAEGVLPDANDPDHDTARKSGLWGNLMAGGAGVEWYFGYNFAHDDLDCEDWRSRDAMWNQTRVALQLFEQHLPFDRMEPADGLASAAAAQCLALPGEAYAVYLPEGGSTSLQLGGDTDAYTVRWYDARVGGALKTGSVAEVSGGGNVWLGSPPPGGDDWAVVLLAVAPANAPPVVTWVHVTPDPFPGGEELEVEAMVADPQQATDVVAVAAHFFTADGDWLVTVPMQPVAGTTNRWMLDLSVSEPIGPATWVVAVQATDAGGLTGINAAFFQTL